jgi:hypothetical protein
LLDSKDLVFAGQIAEEEVSPTLLLSFSFFEALLLRALEGATEQTSTATARIFLSTPGGRDRRAVSVPSYEKT